MNADKFVKLMRTIIAEEVRRVVREELRLSLMEQQSTVTPTKSSYVAGSLKDKYGSLMESDDMSFMPKQKTSVPGVNISNDRTVNSLLAETAQSMQSDPHARSFFEGL